MKRITILLISLALLVSAFTGCSSGDKLSSIKKDGKLVIYMNANFPPFEFMDDGSKIDGVDVRIAQAIADEIGVDLELQNADFDGIVLSISTGKGDMGISGITINDDRKKQVDFSDPYITSIQYFILPTGSALATMEDMAGKRVGSPLGYTGEFVMRDELDEGVLVGKGTELKTYKSAIDASLDILNGKLDAVIMDEFVAKKIASGNAGLKAIPVVYSDGSIIAEEYGVAIQKNNAELLKIVNKVIDKLVSERKIIEWVAYYGENYTAE